MQFPKIIQCGMGVAISNWKLARAVSRPGQLGVVSGTGIETILVRRLQLGDLGGAVRRRSANTSPMSTASEFHIEGANKRAP